MMGLNIISIGCLLVVFGLPFVLTDEARRLIAENFWPTDSLSSVARNGTFGEYCDSSADCDNANNQFCDSIQSKCRCLPDLAYDTIGQECRVTRCSHDGNDYSRDEYLQRNCPPGFECYNSKCTSFCRLEGYNCRTTPEVYNFPDRTCEIAFYSILGLVLLFFGVMILKGIWRRCKRIRCKRVITQHGASILVADSSTPLQDTETPTKVFALCFCVSPAFATQPYMHTCPQAFQDNPYPVVVAQNECKKMELLLD